MIRSLSLLLILATAALAEAAPRFGGLSWASPAPNAAVLRWERAVPAKPSDKISYRIYRKEAGGWNLQTPVATVKATDWVLVDLPAGVPQEYIVRAADALGEDQNKKSMTVTPTGVQPDVEWRGIWVTRFEWPDGDQPKIQSDLRRGFAAFAQGNFNAVIFQVRGQGDTLYPSKDEPWSPLMQPSARNWDPVAFATEEAHKNGLQFHAWINLSTIWQSGEKKLPTDPRHPFYKFADARTPSKCLGLIHDSSGKPRQWGSNNYVWLTPGNPEVNAYLRKQVMDFLTKYPVDGLHWDDNTANPNGVSKDPVSVERFAARGNPMKIKDFGDWQRDQLTRLISDIYVQGKAKQPQLLVTASPFGIEDKNRIPGYDRFSDSKNFGTTPEAWMRQGVVDGLVPQIYWDLPDPEPNYATLVRDWMEHNPAPQRPIWPGTNLAKYGDVQPLIPMQQRYVALCRSMGITGFTFFSWSKATDAQWATDGKKLFPKKASVPKFPHLIAEGQIMGFVGNKANKAIVDGWVRIQGQPYVYLTSADGFFGIPHLRPGNYTVEIETPSGAKLTRAAAVAPGKTVVLTVVE